jgi:predicted DNA-binding transcriptional regulator AlpA
MSPRDPRLVLGEILTDRSLLDRLSADVLVGLRRELGHLAVDLDAALASRQTQQMAPAPAQPLEADRYFTIQEVSTRTGLSVSFLYELARRGDLPTRSLGMGNRPRGYRVLLSDLLAWEASRNKSAVADRVSNMLSLSHDRRRIPTPPHAPRPHSKGPRDPDRRASHHDLQVGAERRGRPGTRGATSAAPQAGESQG